MKLGDIVNPTNHNTLQRIGIAIAMLSLLVLTGIHNPLGGYETTYSYTVAGVQSDPPARPPKMTVREAKTKEEFEQVIAADNAYNSSFSRTAFRDLDFFQWRSEAALLYSLGTLGSLFFYALLVVTGGIVWILVFQDGHTEP
jgi:hypothetical protein